MSDPSMDPASQSQSQKPDRPPPETSHQPSAESRDGRLGPFTIAILIGMAIIVAGFVFYRLTTQGPETATAPMTTDEAAEQAAIQKHQQLQQQMQQQMQQAPASPGSPNTMQPAQPQAPAASPPANKMAPAPSGSPSSSPY